MKTLAEMERLQGRGAFLFPLSGVSETHSVAPPVMQAAVPIEPSACRVPRDSRSAHICLGAGRPGFRMTQGCRTALLMLAAFPMGPICCCREPRLLICGHVWVVCAH